MASTKTRFDLKHNKRSSFLVFGAPVIGDDEVEEVVKTMNPIASISPSRYSGIAG